MKFVTMNPWAASLASRSGNWLMYCSIWPSWFGSSSFDLDEGHDAGRDGGEDQRREDDGAEQQPVGEQVARLLDDHGPDDAEAHSGRLLAMPAVPRRVPVRRHSPTRSR